METAYYLQAQNFAAPSNNSRSGVIYNNHNRHWNHPSCVLSNCFESLDSTHGGSSDNNGNMNREAGFCVGNNIMFDQRVCRGNTYAKPVITEDQKRNRHCFERQQLAHKRRGMRMELQRHSTPPPVKGRLHVQVQTDGMYNKICSEDSKIFSPIIEDNDEEYHDRSDTISSFCKKFNMAAAIKTRHNIIHEEDRSVKNFQVKNNRSKSTATNKDVQDLQFHCSGDMNPKNECMVAASVIYNNNDNYDYNDKIAQNMTRAILEEAKDLIIACKSESIDNFGSDCERKPTQNNGYWSDPE